MAEPRRRMPPWLVGLLVATVIFVLVLFLLDLFGYGDDPVIEGALVIIGH